MSSKKKKILIITLVLVLLIGVIGITYAAFSYTQTGLNQELVTGDIYMHYKESNTLTLENALPSSTYDPNNYFEFQIVGKNTNTKYDIYYDINLNRGLVPTGKLEANRIQDKFLKFRLVEVVNNAETEIFTNKSYNNLSSAKRIHVETINKNTMNEITKTYRLYMWISSDVVIGNTENPNKDYDMATWNNLFGSIRVSVTGDFTEKVMATDDSCFTTSVGTRNVLNTNMSSEELQTCNTYLINLWDNGETSYVYTYNNSRTNSDIQACVSYLTTLWGAEEEGNTVDVGETYQAFCDGTGTIWGNTFQDYLNNSFFESEDLTYFEEHNIVSKKNKYEDFCSGTGQSCGAYQYDNCRTYDFNGMIDRREFSSSDLTYFKEHNIINEETYAEIKDYDASCGSDVIVPSTLPIVSYNNATLNSNMTQEELEYCTTYITSSFNFFQGGENVENFCNGTGTDAGMTFQQVLDGGFFGSEAIAYFEEHNIVSAETSTNRYPVTTIGFGAFENKSLTAVTIPNSVKDIRGLAFLSNQFNNSTDDPIELNTNMTQEELQTCVNYLTNIWGAEVEGDTVDVGETYQSFCDGTGTINGYTFQDELMGNSFSLDSLNYFKEHNIINVNFSMFKVVLPDSLMMDYCNPKNNNGDEIFETPTAIKNSSGTLFCVYRFKNVSA